jgi:streptogrisin C
MKSSYLRKSHNRQFITAALYSAILISISASAAPPQQAPTTPALSKELLSAMSRDLGLNATQAARYLETERSIIARTPEVMSRLGARYAGSWLEADSIGVFRMVVAATDAASAAQARALGAEARVVKRSLAQLEATKNGLDRASKQRRSNAGIHTWYVDVRTNQVVIEADYKAKSAAADFIVATGVDPASIRFQESSGRPLPTNIIGGERYSTPIGGCSIGFPVTRGTDTGFATAGHCGTLGAPTVDANGTSQGIVAGSVYPGNDSAWVRITNPGAFPLRTIVTNYAGGFINIVGSAQAPIGSVVCRSGFTTGYRCGLISANNVTVNYPEGAAFGLTRSTACVGFGDSGGPYITPAGQAQGVTSGGQIPQNTTNNCTSSSPVSFYQPIVPLLNQYGLTLFTGNAGGNGLPVITGFSCPDNNNSGGGTFVCFVRYTSATFASVAWTGATHIASEDVGFSEINGACRRGQNVQMTATITNAAGSVARTSARFACPVGAIP